MKQTALEIDGWATPDAESDISQLIKNKNVFKEVRTTYENLQLFF